MRKICLIGCLLLCSALSLKAQINTSRFSGMGRGGATNKPDTSQHSMPPDTLTLRYYFLGDPTPHTIDSSANDFSKYLQMPASYHTLGNNGNAAQNLIFTPRMQDGFDPGFHSYDIYQFNHDNARFYHTTRPYTELQYLVGSKQEQIIDALHTQDRGERINFSFEYRKVNSPGYYQNQSTNHNMIRATVRTLSQNKRYHTEVSWYSNKINSGENGGIKSDTFLTNSRFKDRLTIPVNVGGPSSQQNTLFGSSTMNVKSAYKEGSILFSHGYDWGKGDTIHINDSTDYYKFDPLFRIQHTFSYSSSQFEYVDNQPDSAVAYYSEHYDFAPVYTGTKLDAIHKWSTLSNDLSVMQFPLRGSQSQFIKVGATFESIKGSFPDIEMKFTNLMLHGEYRNLTRNRKWDFQAKGDFYTAGVNTGDYSVTGSLSRYLSRTLGNVQLLFRNVNTEPGYAYRFFQSTRQTWYNYGLTKQNYSQLSFIADNPKLMYNLQVNYYIFNNYTYLKDFYHPAQAPLFNLLQVTFNKQIVIAKRFNWYMDYAFQQFQGNTPFHVPAAWTRQRLTFEKTLYLNLNLVTGIEAKYFSPYYADTYSNLYGLFVPQETMKINLNSPEVAAFVNFRIKSFWAYIRGENLNTFFAKNNYTAPMYADPNFVLRIGLRWAFVN